ncbi:MAG: hypothetical protein RL033_6944 [Pseudomonadota bacterium]|jgi:serine/threonine-protein kinase
MPPHETLLLAHESLPDAPLGDDAPLSVAYRKGEVIGDKYELIRLLGEGGMGVVWLARNRALGAEVALKLLRAGQRSPTMARRMLKEAQAVARLGHPAILRVFDFGTSRLGDPYMVMEVLDGEDLGRTLERNGRLSPIKAVRTLLPVLHALGTAHQKDIIHRDLKPENIFLTTTDSGYVQPKVVDFGIVKTNEPDVDRLTRVGAVMGTPAYLSPQQARGEDVDQRADIWAAAVVLYEMLTCRLPFEGSNYNALMRSIIEDAPAPLTSFGIDAAPLWEIIERGLAKQTGGRWPSMATFGGALANWLLSQGETDDISGASLRAAWHQGPSAAHPDDLYSARPQTGRGPVLAAVASAPLPHPRRRGLRVAVGVVLGVTALSVALLRPQSSTGATPEQHPEVEGPSLLSTASAASPPRPAKEAAGETPPEPTQPLNPASAAPARTPTTTSTEPRAKAPPRKPTRVSASRRPAASKARLPAADDLKTTL